MPDQQRILVLGAYGLIGAAVCRHLSRDLDFRRRRQNRRRRATCRACRARRTMHGNVYHWIAQWTSLDSEASTEQNTWAKRRDRLAAGRWERDGL